MRRVLQLVSWLALAGMVLSPVLFFVGRVGMERVKGQLLLATIVWFVATPWWMGQHSAD